MTKNNNNQKRTVRPLLVAVAIIVVFLGGIFIGRLTLDGEQSGRPLNFISFLHSENVDFSLVEKVRNFISEQYVDADNIDQNNLIFGAIRGMVGSLEDPHSVFFDEDETRNFITTLNGKFDGIGIEINLRDGNLTVVSPVKNTPAARAGMRPGDIITKINGVDAQGITLEEAVTKIRGEKGTTVILTIKRDGRILDLPIVRDTIQVPSVEVKFEDNIAMVELSHFSQTTADDFAKAAREILNSNADRILLDVRNNPGGFLDAAISVAGWFLGEGKLIVKEDFGGHREQEHISAGPGLLKDFPVVILQNEGSASASEILAGALRDHYNVEIVGAVSFGKGTVQSFEALDGNTSLKLTIARWITPSGHMIDQAGISPTIKIETNTDELLAGFDRQKDKAIEILRNL